MFKVTLNKTSCALQYINIMNQQSSPVTYPKSFNHFIFKSARLWNIRLSNNRRFVFSYLSSHMRKNKNPGQPLVNRNTLETSNFQASLYTRKSVYSMLRISLLAYFKSRAIFNSHNLLTIFSQLLANDSIWLVRYRSVQKTDFVYR